MTTANINDFKANILGGGARANQFQVFLDNPAGFGVGINGDVDAFMVKAASLPGQTITEVPVPFRGRTLYLSGDREFETWTTTIINDTSFKNTKERICSKFLMTCSLAEHPNRRIWLFKMVRGQEVWKSNQLASPNVNRISLCYMSIYMFQQSKPRNTSTLILIRKQIHYC